MFNCSAIIKFPDHHTSRKLCYKSVQKNIYLPLIMKQIKKTLRVNKPLSS